MRVISIEADKQRLGLSLKEVSDEEKARWQQARAEAQAAEAEVVEDELEPVEEVEEVEEADASEPVAESVE